MAIGRTAGLRRSVQVAIGGAFPKAGAAPGEKAGCRSAPERALLVRRRGYGTNLDEERVVRLLGHVDNHSIADLQIRKVRVLAGLLERRFRPERQRPCR